jgi:hypothetical protein
MSAASRKKIADARRKRWAAQRKAAASSGDRVLYEPEDKTLREIEGWILGRQSRTVGDASKRYSATTDPELTDWPRWASESGDVPNFIRAIAEAAFLADLQDYVLLRPVLLELRRRTT